MTVTGRCKEKKKTIEGEDVFLFAGSPTLYVFLHPKESLPRRRFFRPIFRALIQTFPFSPLNLVIRSLRRGLHAPTRDKLMFYLHPCGGFANPWKLRSSPIYLQLDVALMSAHSPGHPTPNFALLPSQPGLQA